MFPSSDNRYIQCRYRQIYPVLFLKLSMCYFCHTRKRGLRALERRLRTLIRTLGLKTLKRTILLETLKYYATFKIRRFESFFYKMNIVLQKTITCIGLQAQQIFSVNILSKFSVICMFFQFWRDFYGSFSMLFPKAPASSELIFELIFTALYFYLYELKKCVSDF